LAVINASTVVGDGTLASMAVDRAIPGANSYRRCAYRDLFVENLAHACTPSDVNAKWLPSGDHVGGQWSLTGRSVRRRTFAPPASITSTSSFQSTGF
jgi:hypothetical protein